MLGLLKRGQGLLAHRRPAAGGHTRPLPDRLGVLLRSLRQGLPSHVWKLVARDGRQQAAGGVHG